MKSRIDNTVKVMLGLFVGVMFVTTTLQAAEIGVKAEGWQSTGTVTEDGTSVTVSFRKQSTSRVPVAEQADLNADETVVPDAFVGDYLVAGIKGLSFRLKVVSDAAELPEGVSLFIIGGPDDMKWTIPAESLRFGSASGEVVANNVELGATHGLWTRTWARGTTEEQKDAAWQQTIQDVKQIGFDFNQVLFDAQEYTVSDFRLLGDGFVSDPAILRELQDNLKLGISNVDELTAELKQKDSDGDGISDYDEIMNGDDPGLAVKIVSVEPDGITIEWPKAANRRYMLVRSSSLLGGFTEVVMDSPLTSDQGVMTYKDTTATNAVPYFYRVIKKK